MRAVLLFPLIANLVGDFPSCQYFLGWIDLQEYKLINVATIPGLTGLFDERQTMQINTNSAKGNQVTVKWYCWLGNLCIKLSWALALATSSLQLTQSAVLEGASKEAQSPSRKLPSFLPW